MKNNFLFINLAKKNIKTYTKFYKKSLDWKNKINIIICSKYRVSNFLKNIFHKKVFTFKKKPNTQNLCWSWELILGIFFLLFGFFSATSAITIIGSVADWDPLAAAVMLCWTEFFSKIFYTFEKKTLYLKLINSFKVGINLGMFVDALKLTS